MTAPLEPEGERRKSVLHRISLHGKKMDAKQMRKLRGTRGTQRMSMVDDIIGEVDEENSDEESNGDDDENQEEDIDYTMLLGEDYKPRSTCTGHIHEVRMC